MNPIKIDPKFAGSHFVPVALDADYTECALALSGSALVNEFEPQSWRVSAELLNSDGSLEQYVLGDSFFIRAEADELADFINGEGFHGSE
jgi:hypothetical protein